jgi:outer membrane immunogenic protein
MNKSTLGIAVIATLIGSHVFAADMPLKAPPYEVLSWSGFYLGANIGGGWARSGVDYTPNDPTMQSWFDPAPTGEGGKPPATSISSSGVIGGVQVGYNWQVARIWVVGIETDFDGSGVRGSSLTTSSLGVGTFPFTETVGEHVEWFGTVRPRLGVLVTPNLLAYGTGGFAYGRVEDSGSYVNASGTAFSGGTGVSFSCNPSATCFAGSSSRVATGWTAGAGLEYALSSNLFIRAEYLYVGLSGPSMTQSAVTPSTAFVANPIPASFNANFSRTNLNVARFGVDFRLQ